MALSNSILEKIKKDKEDKQNGVKDGTTSTKDKSTQGSNSSSGSSLSSTIQDRVAMDYALKQLGLTHNKDTGLLNDSRYSNYRAAASSVDQNYINKFYSDWSSYNDKLKTAYDGMNWQTAQTWGQDKELDDTGKDLMFRSAMIRSYLDSHKDDLDEESYRGLVTNLENIQKAKGEYDSWFTNTKKFYSQWDTEEEYNFWQDHSTVENRQNWYEEQQKRLEELKSQKKAENARWNEALVGYDPESHEFMTASQEFYSKQKAIDDEIAAVEAEMANYKRGNYNEFGQYYGNKTLDDYHAITERPDFKVTSANRDYDNPTREELWEYDSSASEGSVALGYGGSYDEEGNILDINGNIVRYAKGPEVEDKLGMFFSAGEKGVQEAYNQLSINSGNYTDTWANIMQEGDTQGWKYLDDTEIGIYYALLDDSQEAAYKFLADMAPELTRRETMAKKAYIEEAPVLEQILLNAASIPMNVVGGGVAFAADVISGIKGEEINPYSRAHAMQNTASFIREDTARDINNLTGNVALPWVGTTFGDVYQSLMSAGDMAYGAMLGGGGQVYATLMGMGAASTEAKRLYDQGASMEQIAAGGILAGAAEMVFEKLSIENLINMKDAKSASQLIKNLLTQGGIEASEEMATEIANTITNVIVMGKQSDWVDLETFARNVVNAGIGGFISGGFGGGVGSVASYSQYNQQAKDTGKTIMGAEGGVDALKALAMDVSGADSKLAKQANKVTGETVDGKGLKATVQNNRSQKAVGKLYDSVQTEVTKQNQTDIAKRIEEVGFSPKSAKNIASAVMAQVNGEELSKVQKAALDIVKGNEKVQEAISGILEDGSSSVNKRNLNLDTYSLGINLGVGISPKASETSAAQAEKPAAKSITVSENGKMMNTETNEVIDHPVLAQAEDGSYKIVDHNSGLVSSENVSYESHDQGLVVESFAKLGEDFGKVNKVLATMDLSSRNKLMSLYNPELNPDGGMFVNGVLDAYFYGHRGVDLSVAQKGSPINKLTEQQRQIAWETGRAAGEKATAAEQSNVDAVYAEAQKVLDQTGKKKGAYHATLEAGISHFNLTPEQKVVYNVAEEIAQGIQTNIRVYNGTDTAQGFYSHETDEIMLNLNAANKGRDAIMAFTLAHEIVHRAKKGSPAKYQAFTEFLMKEYGKQGSDVEAMIQAQMDAAEKFNKTVPKAKQIAMTEEKALEEVVCDACATMLLDTNAGQKLAEFGAQSKENRGFLEDLKRWISDLLERLRNYFKGIDPKSDAAREFAKFEENVKQTLANMYVEMATEAGEKLSTIKAAYGGLDSVLKKNAEAIAEDAILTEGAVVTDGERSYSIKSMKADIAEGKMFEDLKNVCGWTQSQVNELKQSLEELVEYMTPFRDILDMNETYGREGRRFSPYKPNSDPLYKISMDFSTLCSKRLLTQYVIENLQLRENRPMSAEEQMAIRDMLNEYRKVEKGLQVACAMCYVEAARLKSPKQMQRWLNDPAPLLQDYFGKQNKEFNDSVKKAQADFKESRGYDRNAPKKDMKQADIKELNKIGPKMRAKYQVSEEEAKIIERAKSLPSSTYLTAGNLANLSETDPVIYTAYTAFVRTATRSKSLETDEPYYYGDSTRDNGNGIVVTDSFIESVNRENGMRFSSWSDWRIQHLLDYITAVIDNSVRGAAMHGYTKFGDEVRVLGKTGMMFNMSGVAGSQTGLNEDGSLSFSDTESIDVNEAIQLRDEFPETAGLQCIGVSHDHIVALLRSDIIDYVIPYHVSGLNAGLRAMANIHGWDDFTSTQHAAIDKSIKLEDAVDKDHWREEPVFSEFFVGYDTGMTGIEAMRASADRYVQMCKDRGLKPKFEQFLGEENYWKLLIDRKMINQKTGKLIQQRAVTPTFDFGTIKGVVDKYVQNYDSGMESRALNHIVENWDNIPKRIKDLKKQGSKKAKKAKKAADTLANQTLAAQLKGVEQGERSYSLPKAQNQPYRKPAYDEWDVSAALDDALEHADHGDDNLILVGEMPHFISDMLGIEGDFYIYRNHVYENMVSKEQAIEDHRPTKRKKKDIHFHNLGKEKVQDAILALEYPIMTIADSSETENPQVVMVLPVHGNNDAPLYAALSFYSDQPINGALTRKPHIVLTIAERGFFAEENHDGYVEVINNAIDNGNVISYDKEKMRDYLSVIAGHTRVGNITEKSLKENLAQFVKKIKSFREKNKIYYKLPIGEDTSPRALLAGAFEGIITNDIERRNIQEYKGKVEMLNEEEKKLSELRAQIKELSFAKGKRDTKKIKELQFEANHTANRIATLDKTLLRLEASTPLQNILKREKEMAYKRGLEKNREKNKTARQQVIETREKRYAREKLQKLVIETAKWISYPSKTDVKCPDILKQPYADFLNGIDLSSKRKAEGGDPTKNDLRLTNAMDSLATALDRVMASQDPNQDTTAVLDTGYLDLPAGFVQKIRDMTESIKAMMVEGEFVVNTMTAAEVRQLSQIIRTLNHAIKEVSTLYANLRFANVEALGDETMTFIDELGEIQKTGSMKDFVQWENALPYYAFKRFGNGGESIFEGLMDAQDKLAYLAQQIFDFREKAWKGDEAKEWSEDTHTIDLPDGEALTLTTADAMSIYCLSRREQGLKHLLGGGTRVMGIQKGSKKAQDSRSLLTIKDVDAIISSLTDRQKQVAETIQEFMSTTCSEWGNEISMKRFLTKEFNEKFYFPIESNDENLPTKDPSAQQSDLFRLLNISATKPIDPNANNEVIIRNIFDVFTGHASDMARLNAYGMPLLDYMKWLNYREKTVTDEGQVKVRGVRKSMEKAYGNAAKSYVLNLIKDVNGRASDGGDPTILMKWMRAAKTASVGASLRVATLQITSYPRAALVLSPKSLTLGLSKLPKAKMAKKYCGIALWKSFGFYDTNIARSIEDQMKGVKDVKQTLIEWSLKGAEWGDAITWGALWNACEYEVAATKEYKVGTEEFYQAVGKKLREVVYATQVVDSTLTRSQMMRSKRGMAQEAAAFMSEPTLSANILMDAGFQFNMEKRRTGSAEAAWKKTGKYIGRSLAVYSIGQLAAALLESLSDAWRDDDDEKFKEKYRKAFLENLALDLVPFNKIPIVSDVFEAALAMFNVGFYSSDKMSTTWLTQAVSAVEAWKEVLSGESSKTIYNALYKSVRALSSYYGVAVSGVMREGVAFWNNIVGDSTLKIRQYELSKADLGNELYEAIVTGDTKQASSLNAQFEDQNSISSALRKALRENDPRIREAAIAWNANDLDEYMRIAKEIIAEKHFVQDDVVMAIRAEASALAPDDGEPSTSKAKGLFTAEKFAEAIAQGDQAMANAIKIDVIQTAQKNGKTEEEAEKSFASTAKGDLKELFTAGSINESQAIEALTTYCGESQEDAEDRVESWVFEKEYGFMYSDRGEAYKAGAISASELKAILMSAGGKTAEEADLQIQAYDWEAQGYENVTAASVRDYNEHCSTANVPKDVYLHIRSFSNDTKNDVDANGKTIYYSAMKKVMAEINAQYGLTAEQKTAIARSLGWAEKNINKYKLW